MSFAVNHLIGFGAKRSASAAGVPYSETSSTPNTSGAGAGYTMFCREFAIDNSSTITEVGVYSTTATTIVVKIGLDLGSGTSFDIVASQSFSHGGAGWEDVTLSTPVSIPASGTYYAGFYCAPNINAIGSVARSYKLGDITGTGQTGFTADVAGANCPGVRVAGTKP
jgi:hypothetical protein